MATIKPKKVSTGTGRTIVFGLCSLGFFGALVVGIAAMYRMDQREVEIVKFSRDVAIGTEITQADIEMGTILTAEYNDKANSSWIGNDGKKQSGQIYVKWDNAKDIVGMYVTNARRIDDAVTLRDLSAEEIEPNPWFSKIPAGNELYTMKFDASDTYTRMLMPGCTIRMRIITDVDVDKADQFRAQIAKKTAGGEKGINNDNGYISAILPYYSAPDDEGKSSKSSKSVPVAEVVFENLVMLDSVNQDGESLFDIYYSLVNMDSTVRENYIRENADTLRTRLIPASLIMSLTPDQATSVSEFENSDFTSYKYTIVKTDPNAEDEENIDPETGEPIKDENARIGNDLYGKFMDIATRINTITINPSTKK